MKKLFILFMLLFASVFVYAEEAKEDSPSPDDYTCLQFCFFPGVPKSSVNSNVYGLKTGWPMAAGHGKVEGVEVSWFASATDNIEGVQACWVVNKCKTLSGAQVSWIFNIGEESDGAQLTWLFNINKVQLTGLQFAFLFNYSMGEMTGLQVGALEIAETYNGIQPGAICIAKEMNGFQPAAVMSVTKDLNGCQASTFMNYASGRVDGAQVTVASNFAEDLGGFQASAVNVANKSNGFQLGLVNVSSSGGGQIGIINYIKDGVIPFLPFMNFSY